MTEMVSLTVLVFMIGVGFMFWLGGIAAEKYNYEKPQRAEDTEHV
jgi:hypothetical protein